MDFNLENNNDDIILSIPQVREVKRKGELEQNNQSKELEELALVMNGEKFERKTDGVNFSGSRKTAKVSGETQLKTSTKGYLVMAVYVSGGNKAYLYDIDYSRFLLVSDADLDIEIDGRTLQKTSSMFETEHGEQNGYVLYKNNEKNLDFLDSNFTFQGKSWRDNLRTRLPEVKIKNSTDEYLWRGEYDGENCFLYEYSEKCLAFFTPKVYADVFGRKMNCTINGKSYSVYYVPKSKAKTLLNGIVDVDYGSQYKLSAPTKSVPKSAKYVMLEEKNTIIKMKDEDGRLEEIETKIKLYDISKDCFGFTSSEEIEFDFTKSSIVIDDLPVFIFPKSNATIKDRFKKITKMEVNSVPKSEFSEELSKQIPKAQNEMSSFFTFVSSIGKLKLESDKRFEFGNKYAIIGSENIETDDKLIFSGTYYSDDNEIKFFMYEKNREI